MLQSTEVHDLQVNGWIYTSVLGPDDSYTVKEHCEYTTIINFNKWGDQILFRREVLR